MSKIFKKIIAITSVAFCLGGVAVNIMPVDAFASNLNYHTDYDNLKMQTIYTQGDKATVVVNAGKDALESGGGVTLECRDSNYNYISFTSLSYAGTRNFDNGDSVTTVYNNDTGKYEVTFTIYKNTISAGARGYFYIYGNYSGVIMDENGGYGYQLW